MNANNPPVVSPKFTVDDIRALRDYYGPLHFKMPEKDLLSQSREAGDIARRRIAEIKAQKIQARQG